MTENNPNVPPPGDVPPPVSPQPTDASTPPPAGPPLGYEPQVSARAPETNPDAKMWGMLAHIAALAGYIIPIAGSIVGPLVVWLIKKDQLPFVDDQGKESLNFQITVAIAALVAGATLCIGIGLILLPLVGILDLVFIIIAAVKANSGQWYRYPFAIRFVK